MEFVVDIETLLGSDRQLVVKELAIVPVDAGKIRKWTFKPPTSWENLPREIQTRNNWATANLHHLQWDDGFAQYQNLRYVIDFHIPPGSTVYVKGLEKRDFIGKLVNRGSVVELGAFGCPNSEDLPRPLQKCTTWSHYNLNVKHCALYKAQQYVNWLRSI